MPNYMRNLGYSKSAHPRKYGGYSGTKTAHGGGTKTGYAGTKTSYSGTKSGYGGTKNSYGESRSWDSSGYG